jgi:glycosyltransferase involved in cell wall biosynthesis
MNEVKLSYVMTTRNKLPYLKQTLPRLIKNRKENEEILVADGASTDGTKDYLESLKQGGLIDHYISEPDSGEAHGLNKLFLTAKGILITIITDDDVFDFKSLQTIKNFMLEHPEIDYTGSEGGAKNQNLEGSVRPLIYENNYRKWQNNHTPFASCALGLVYQRSSIALLGLWNTSYKRLDAEFTLRNTSGKTNIAWYTGHSYVNISNPQSTSLVYMKRIKNEGENLNRFYLGIKPNSLVSQKFNALVVKIKSGTLFRTKNASSKTANVNWEPLAKISEEWLEKTNKEKKLEFIWNKK